MEENYREVKKAEPCLKLIHMDQVEVEEIKWLFYPFIPYGKVTIIQGDPGEGKTTVVLQIIAKLTKGEAILSETSEGKSEETGVEPINVIYQTAEDGLGDTIKRYNAKQIRSDRKIKDYYEKIRSSKQEKPFHEIILQVGGKGNMNADTENGELAKQILDEYYQGFQERNPQLRVFSAHLHMDEATPHLHIDFVPFTTGSKRGLDTRVSLKQALATQGFKGGSRGDTEWSQWIQSEKEQLAAVMERYGIEWEHLGTHEKHLSVLDYKKQEREKEVAALGAKIEQKQIEFDVLSERVLNYDKAKDELSNLEIELDTAPKYQLPEPEKFMTAKAYKTKMAEPVVRKLKQLVKTVLARCFEGWDNYHRLNTANAQLYRTNQRLEKVNERLTEENKILKAENKDYSLLRKVFGRKQIDDLLEQARTVKGRKRDNTRSR